MENEIFLLDDEIEFEIAAVDGEQNNLVKKKKGKKKKSKKKTNKEIQRE